jgi:hypothetical protein
MDDLVSFLTANHDLVAAITAVAALVVSTISIFLAIFNMTTQRTHNRKSLMPIAHVRLGDYENRLFVELHNDGIGPMLIDTIAVSKSRGWSKKHASFSGLVPALPPGILWSTFVTDLSGRALSAGKDIVILLLEGDASDQNFLAATATSMARKCRLPNAIWIGLRATSMSEEWCAGTCQRTVERFYFVSVFRRDAWSALRLVWNSGPVSAGRRGQTRC